MKTMKKFFGIVTVLIALLVISAVSLTSPASALSKGDVIEFGSYPQTQVKDENLISQLNSKVSDWQSYGYTWGNGSYGSEKAEDYMQYTDILYNGSKYRGVKYSKGRPTATFGTGENTYLKESEKNIVKWYLYEPIKWYVINPSSGILFASTVLDSQPWGATNTSYGGNVMPYNDSLIKKWLNSSFSDTAFNAYDKKCIKEIRLPSHNNEGKIDNYRYIYADYYLSQGGWSSEGWYWTNSIYDSEYIYVQGIRYLLAGSAKTNVGVRPVIQIDLDAYHKWNFDTSNTTLTCSYCNETYYLSSNKNFKFGRDNFSFRHTDVGSYDISEIGMEYMNSSLKLDFVALSLNKISEGVNYIKNEIKNNDYGTWGGSCFGIACMDASFLSTLNTFDYNGSSVYSLSLDTKLKDSINIMMYSQASVYNISNNITNTFSNMNKVAIDAAKSISTNSYLPVLNYTGHAVNIIGILPDDYDPNYYVLSTYDCNHPDEPQFIIISKDYKNAYLGKFVLNDYDTPIHATSNKIEIIKVITEEANNINYWAPGLSSSALYYPSKSRMVHSSSIAINDSSNEEIQTNTNNYVRFLLASDEELLVTADDRLYFIFDNGKITKTNIDNMCYEYLSDFGVTKVTIPSSASSYKIESNNQYYANVGYNDKISVFYCEKGGISTFDIDGIASVDTSATKSYAELSCYKYDIIANSNYIGILANNSSSNTKIDFSTDSPLIETNNIKNVNLQIQHNDREFSQEEIPFEASDNIEYIMLKFEEGNIVADVHYHEHTYSSEITKEATHTETGKITYTCSCGNMYIESIPKTTEHAYLSSQTVTPTCETEGYTTYTCICGDTYNDNYVPAIGHNYENQVCTNCGQECSHLCHESGFFGFIWKIVRFFWKLFGINPKCVCGTAHY